VASPNPQNTVMPVAKRPKAARVVIAVTLPQSLSDAIKDAMTKENISLRKKSRWIAEALDQLIRMGSRYILEHDILSGRCLDAGGPQAKVHTLTFDEDLHLALISLIAELRQSDPFINASQSVLVRTAILRRLDEAVV